MIYIIKSILCSALLITVYYIFLEREKVHTFKRFYLLACIVLSLVIPALSLEITRTQPVVDQYFSEIVTGSQSVDKNVIPALNPVAESNKISWRTVLFLVYGTITGFLLIRFCISYFSLRAAISSKKVTRYRNAFIITDDKTLIPYTFLNYIFLNAKDFENRQILMHELTHTRQKHTLDILFVEFIHCLFWFNPVLFLYKKAMRLNHEFLADEKVIKNHAVSEYQQLLLNKSQVQSLSSLTSSLNYSVTKKRFIMMTTMKNQTRAFVKITLSCLLLLCAAAIFPEKVYAQDTPPQVIQEQDSTVANIQKGSEFDSLICKYMHCKTTKTGDMHIWFNVTGITQDEKTRMKELYEAMSAQEKAKYPEHVYMVFTNPPPPKKKSPTAGEMAAYADPAIYGIWLDGKRVANTALAKYKPSDIALVWTSRLMKNAAHYGQYKFHAEVMTHAYFDKTFPSKSN